MLLLIAVFAGFNLCLLASIAMDMRADIKKYQNDSELLVEHPLVPVISTSGRLTYVRK